MPPPQLRGRIAEETPDTKVKTGKFKKSGKRFPLSQVISPIFTR